MIGRDYLNDHIERLEKRLAGMKVERQLLKGGLLVLREAVAYLDAQPLFGGARCPVCSIPGGLHAPGCPGQKP